MFTYYQVNGRYKISRYKTAQSFARQIGGKVEIKKSWNPLRLFDAIYDAI